MSALRRDVHGLVVELDDRVGGRPTGALFDAFAPAASAEAPALRLRLLPAATPRPLPPGAALFFHGSVRAVAIQAVTVVGDGASILSVSADGSAIDGEIHERSLSDAHAFSHTALLMALLVALRHHGLFHLHAASLRARSGAGLLVAANAGAGKSTVALALAAAGWDFVGDDTVLLARRGGRPRLLGLPRPFHVGEATASAFPGLAPFLGSVFTGTGKRFLEPEAAFGRAALRETEAPGILLFPSIGSGPESRIAALPPAESLGKLIESSALIVVDGVSGVPAQLGLLRELVDGARGFRVELGRDLLEAPAEWAAWLARATGVGA